MNEDSPRTNDVIEEMKKLPRVEGEKLLRAFCRKLEQENAVLRLEMERSALWATSSCLYLNTFKGYVRDFMQGVHPAPHQAAEPRVMGFKREFDELKARMNDPVPSPPSTKEVKETKL